MRSSYRFFTGFANVAGGKAVTAALQYSSLVAEKGNDCDLGSIYHSGFGQVYAWWTVDLGDPVLVHAVRLFPDYSFQLYIDRFHHVEVSVGSVAAAGGDASTYTVVGTFVGPFDNSSCCSVDFTFDPPLSRLATCTSGATPL
ncbi:uncharacterized protein [Penaeus vannamei]|uniref:uncharacterized protein n=1 Tax=Penaeus vannamei TaxID=6689 RepID=UPI00387F6F5F